MILASLVSLAAVPSLAAESGSEAEGTVAVAGAMTLTGAAEFVSRDASLDYSPVARNGAFTMNWSSASGYIVTKNRTFVATTGGPPDDNTRPVTFEAGSLSAIGCKEHCEVFAFTEPGEGRLGLAGTVDGALAATGADEAHWAGHRDPTVPHAFSYIIPRGAVRAVSGPAASDATGITDARAITEGRVGILLWNVTVTIDAGGQTHRYETGATHTTAAGPGTVEQSVARFMVIYAEDAQVTSASAPGIIFSAKAPTVNLNGTLRATSANGFVGVDGEREPIAGETIEVVGILRLYPEFITDASGDTSPLASGTPQLTATFAGSAEYVSVGSARVAGGIMASALTRTVVTASALAGLATLAYVARRFLAAIFYSRFERSKALENDNRRAVLEALKKEPGASVADLCRITDLTRIVVRHHLSVLATHQFVSYRRQGRRLSYFAAAHPPQPRSVDNALHNPTRRVIAGAIVKSETPLTQRELADLTGLSRRLVAYHLKELERAELVDVDESMPRTYARTEALAEHAAPAQ